MSKGYNWAKPGIAVGGAGSRITYNLAPWACTKWLTPERPVSFRMSPSHRQPKFWCKKYSWFTYQEWILSSNSSARFRFHAAYFSSGFYQKESYSHETVSFAQNVSFKSCKQHLAPTISLWKLVSRGGEVTLHEPKTVIENRQGATSIVGAEFPPLRLNVNFMNGNSLLWYSTPNHVHIQRCLPHNHQRRGFLLCGKIVKWNNLSLHRLNYWL
jgi:hypothetical protein